MVEGKLFREVTRAYVDVETGETRMFRTEEALKKRPPRDMRSLEPFAMIFPDAIAKLALLGLTTTDWRVLMHLVGIMGFEDPFRYSAKEIGVAIDVHRNNVSRSISRLKELGILIDLGHRRVYIHPDYFWRGSLKARIQVMHHLEKNRSGSATGVQFAPAPPAGPEDDTPS